jgi:RND superfamily putative drug exporter
MFDALAGWVNRRGWLIVLIWVILAVTLAFTAPPWSSVSKDDDVRFFPPQYPTVRAQDLLERGFPGDVASSSLVLVVERAGGALQAADFAYLDEAAQAIGKLGELDPKMGIRKIVDRRTVGIGPRLVSPVDPEKGQAALAMINLSHTYISRSARIAVDKMYEAIGKLPPAPEGLVLGVTGTAAVGHDTNVATNKSIEDTTLATIVLVVIILLVVYRSPLLAFIPLATIALSVWASLKAIALMTRIPNFNFQVINITNVFVVVVLFGAGTDYCLFLIARYREELARGRSAPDALAEALRQVGHALVASAGTVILGLGTLYASTFQKIQYTGPAIGLALAIALIAALTLAPVLLRWLRGFVFWPFKPPHHEAGRDTEEETLAELPMHGFWVAIADVVVRRPLSILLVSVLAMAPLVYIGTQAKPSYNQLTDLGSNQPCVRGARIVQRHFAAGEMGPAMILIHHPGLDFQSEPARRAVEALAVKLSELPEVAEVRSASRPLGKTLLLAESAPASPENAGGARNGGLLGRLGQNAQRTLQEAPIRAVRSQADAIYISTAPRDPADRNQITRLNIVFRDDPFSSMSMSALEQVGGIVSEAVSPGGVLEGAAEFGLAGSTAMVNDLKTVTTQDEHRMYVLVTVGVYLILVVLLRRPGICLYLILTVVLGYLASLGVTEVVFRALHDPAQGPWQGLDWKVGFFLFVILVAVGEDYNIFLMSRVVEEEEQHGVVEGVRRAIAHTGGIISSCGVIMAGTFGSMLFGSLRTLHELGFALGLGVLFDTFIVRPILVPAFVVLIHQHQAKRKLGRGHAAETVSGNGAGETGAETKQPAASQGFR